MSGSNKRRRFLLLGAVGVAGLTAYSVQRGIRYPMLSLEPAAPAKKIQAGQAEFILTDVLHTSGKIAGNWSFRAYAPQPSMSIYSEIDQVLRFTINNLASDARLLTYPAVALEEQTSGISRTVELELRADQNVTLYWHLPALDSYSFAAIGDSGGDMELGWCIQRAHQLGARFLLHLGDFNYQPGDYETAIELFNNSPIPVYVSVGNHDFHASGLVYQDFLRQIGPFNHQFVIGKTRFVNFDTAASMFPYSAGQRGELMRSLISDTADYVDTVAFTHRPLHDPQEDSDHDIGNEGERDWLVKQLTDAGVDTLLSGHIHIYDRSTVFGIDNIIVGQGLGHQDLIVNGDHSKMAIGRVDQAGRVSYEMAPLAMPMELHCNPRTDPVKQSLQDAPHADVIREIDRACAAAQGEE